MVITSEGGANQPSDTLPPGKAGGTVAVRRTLATTICRVGDPTQVPRSTVMRFRPAHQNMINRRHNDRASCLARNSLNLLLPVKPRICAPATWNGGNESGENLTVDIQYRGLLSTPQRSFRFGPQRRRQMPEAV